MNNWTIGKRIISGFAAVLLITLSLGAYVYLHLRSIQANTTSIITDSLPGTHAIGVLEASVENAQSSVYQHLLTEEPETMAALEKDITKSKDEVSQIYTDYEKTIFLPEDRRLFDKMKSYRPDYLHLRDEVLSLSRASKKKEAFELARKQLEPLFDNYMASVRAEVDFNKKDADDASGATTAAVSSAQHGLIFGVALAVLAGLGIAFVITRGIGRVLGRVAASVEDGTEQIASAAGQVSTASQTLAEGASEQAASIEETSSSLEEMSSMTKRNADNAQNANELAKQARAAAEKGAGDMQAMSQAMEAIKVSSDDIAKIIKTIDEIAFQTNILALNAAVEAARAGEAGMGFAVVADEVRNLAQRSAQAARETADKIEGAIAKTAQGVGISSKVAEALNEIVAKARQVDELASEVANASREQTQGISQINVAVGQMDKVTQGNAASAEESAAAAQELNAQASTMKQSVAELLSLIGNQESKTQARRAAPRGSPSRPVPAKNGLTASTPPHRNGHHPVAAAPAPAENHRLSEIPLEQGFRDF